MNGTNRALNRALLGVFGLVLAVAGACAVMAGTSRGFAQHWTSTSTTVWARIQERLDAARISGTETSWWSIAVLAVLLVVAVALVAWIASQGTGRSNHLAQQRDSGQAGGTAGSKTAVAGSMAGATVVDTAVAVQLIKAGLDDNQQILGASVQSWALPGLNRAGCAPAVNGLKISVQTRKGASPAEVTAAVEQLVDGLDQLLGVELPVLIRIKAGTRTRFARTERVA